MYVYMFVVCIHVYMCVVEKNKSISISCIQIHQEVYDDTQVYTYVYVNQVYTYTYVNVCMYSTTTRHRTTNIYSVVYSQTTR